MEQPGNNIKLQLNYKVIPSPLSSFPSLYDRKLEPSVMKSVNLPTCRKP